MVESAGERPKQRRLWPRRLGIALVVLALLGVGLYYAVPWLQNYFTHVSTDDAYVSGNLTYLGPRVASRVEEVMVNETDFIRAGEVLVRLDPQPFELAIEEAKANLQLAQANLDQARSVVRSELSTARANQYLTQSAIDQVRYQVASLQSAVAELKLNEAQRTLAEENFARDSKLRGLGVIDQQAYDQSLATVKAARDRVVAQTEAVQQVRAQLGLPRNTQDPAQIPNDVEQIYPPVQTALSNWATSLIQIGVPLNPIVPDPTDFRKELDRWTANQLSHKTIDALVDNAPSVQVARAKVSQAQAALDQAQLNLSYTEINAPFDGFVTRRTVNPGDYATVGQNLLAVQSLRDVWVDANFKETQIHDLLIGMPVSVYVDAYPGVVFPGRVAGFSPATGSRLSLLPPENATGNFVKIVQRLPVRIEFDEPPSAKMPLFLGLSVEPEVDLTARPRGPHAGGRLRVPPSDLEPSGAVPPAANGKPPQGASP